MSTLDWRLWAGMQWNIVVSVVKRSQVSAFGEIGTCYFLEVSYFQEHYLSGRPKVVVVIRSHHHLHFKWCVSWTNIYKNGDYWLLCENGWCLWRKIVFRQLSYLPFKNHDFLISEVNFSDKLLWEKN